MCAALLAATSDDTKLRSKVSHGNQPLVDAALLTVEIHRAGPVLWEAMEKSERRRVLAAL